MGSRVVWTTSKKYPGIRWHEGVKGKTFYITFTRNGKKIWEKVGSESEGYSVQLAATVRANRIKSLRHGEELPQDRKAIPTFGEVAERYLEWAKQKKSYRDDLTRYRMHVEPRFKDKYVDSIRPLDLERLKRDMAGEGKAPATIRQALALFRGIFNKGRQWALIRCENPISAVKMPVVDNARERLLSPDEVQQLLTELQKTAPRAYELALMAYHTGARKGELFSITWSDVDLNARIVTFRGTKNGKTRRIPLNEEAFNCLATKKAGTPTEYVFGGEGNERLQFVSSAFQRTAKRLFNDGITDSRHKVVFHSLRHAFASRLVSEGVPLNVVKELTGHRSLAMLERYSHLMPNAQKEAVKLLSLGSDKSKVVALRGEL